jgi:DNA-binding PadR family transcriptional regulator
MSGSRSQLNPIALAALEVLHEGPKHPYEIHQTLRDRHSWRLFKLSAGSLYHAIERMERDGLIEVVETSREGRRPERTTYRLAGPGRDAFAQRLREMVGERATEYPSYLMGVAYLHTLERGDALKQLRKRALELDSRSAAQRVVVQQLTDKGLPAMFWMDVRLELHMMEAELSWTNWLLGELESGRVSWPDGAGAGLPGPSISLVRDLDKEVG